MLMSFICAALYTLGAFLYHLHQLTIIYLKEVEGYNEAKVRFNDIIWPLRVLEHVVESIMFLMEDDSNDDGGAR
jgi:hypothetical protein